MNGSIILIIILVLFSGFFSSCESAFFSINPNRVKSRGKTRTADYIIRLLSEKERLLSTILIGNLIVNIFYFSFTSDIVVQVARDNAVLGSLSALGFFAVLLIFGEILPKTIAVNIPVKVASFGSHVIIWFFRIFYPANILLRYALIKTRRLTDRILSGREAVLENELDYIVDFTHKGGSINIKEKHMLFGGADFDQLRVKTFMTPRMKISACDIGADKEEFIRIFKSGMHSNVIVFQGNIENTLGYVNTKDIFLAEKYDLKAGLKRLLFIPELTPLRKAYSLFSRYGLKIAGVVNEYGGLQGILTNEDIVEAITGDIDDEFRNKILPFEKISDKKYTVSGDMVLRSWAIHFPGLPGSEGSDTLAGYLEMAFGCIPKKGDELTRGGMKFTVLSVSNIRIDRVMVEFL